MGEHSVTDQPTAQSSTLRWLPVLIVVVLVLLLFVQLRDILMPFAVGALIAYLGDPLVDLSLIHISEPTRPERIA